MTLTATKIEVGTRVKVPEYFYKGGVPQEPVYRREGIVVRNSSDTDRHYPGSLSVWIDGQKEPMPHLYLADRLVLA